MRVRPTVLLALALIITACPGCARRFYRWSSDLGRQCFNECQRGRYQCYAGCFNNVWCQGACNNDEVGCMNSCPDLQLVQPGASQVQVPQPNSSAARPLESYFNKVCANADCSETITKGGTPSASPTPSTRQLLPVRP